MPLWLSDVMPSLLLRIVFAVRAGSWSHRFVRTMASSTAAAGFSPVRPIIAVGQMTSTASVSGNQFVVESLAAQAAARGASMLFLWVIPSLTAVERADLRSEIWRARQHAACGRLLKLYIPHYVIPTNSLTQYILDHLLAFVQP